MKTIDVHKTGSNVWGRIFTGNTHWMALFWEHLIAVILRIRMSVNTSQKFNLHSIYDDITEAQFIKKNSKILQIYTCMNNTLYNVATKSSHIPSVILVWVE